ncbi:hypothetical protein JCGZ_09698 [Jatropha curcas]|uniref:Uncharacterized protein n=1 Tax=Jatropha curcas TaxID=180498 RepID=A0A067LM15_JATCU|nr:hypothetical protein JCGZ_09698 [Jatropha curcas]
MPLSLFLCSLSPSVSLRQASSDSSRLLFWSHPPPLLGSTALQVSIRGRGGRAKARDAYTVTQPPLPPLPPIPPSTQAPTSNAAAPSALAIAPSASAPPPAAEITEKLALKLKRQPTPMKVFTYTHTKDDDGVTFIDKHVELVKALKLKRQPTPMKVFTYTHTKDDDGVTFIDKHVELVKDNYITRKDRATASQAYTSEKPTKSMNCSFISRLQEVRRREKCMVLVHNLIFFTAAHMEISELSHTS